MTPTIDLLRSHRSIRHFTDDAISDAQREAIIAAAQGTSSSSFLQCTTIVRITDNALRESLAELYPADKNMWCRPPSSGYFALTLIAICRFALTRNSGWRNSCYWALLIPR